MIDIALKAKKTSVDLLTGLPFVVWMILTTLLLALVTGHSSKELITLFNAGWGFAIGEFALILLPSFVLAAALERLQIQMGARFSIGLAPMAGAGMICPDTAYASISPMIRTHKLPVAFGAYTGFKLLYPAGPLIVATGLGVSDNRLLAFCVLVFVPVWAVSVLYGRFIETRLLDIREVSDGEKRATSLSALWPLVLLALLLVTGMVADLSFNVWLDFATNPKGALILTAAAVVAMVEQANRRDCIDSGLRRTGSLLLIIGAASAFSAVLTNVVPVGDLFSTKSQFFTMASLFFLTAIFKVLQGSSMSTFAAVGPFAMPIVTASEVSPILAVISICLGSFVAILPNDSYYWLVRQDALPNESDVKATAILASGSVLLAASGMVVLFSAAAIFSF
jgi:GntP family gluconate:H+ symporter